MDERATGLILRTRPLTETSLIVHWLTPDLGRLATVAKGARRPKSPFRGKLDLFYIADFSFVRSRRSELHTLREANLRATHPELRADLEKLRQAAYCVALIELVTETDTPLEGIYELLTGFLDYLATHPVEPKAIFAFETKLLNESGLQPDAAGERLGEGARQVLRWLGGSAWADLPKLHVSSSQVAELQHFLTRFLADHLGRVPRGRLSACK